MKRIQDIKQKKHFVFDAFGTLFKISEVKAELARNNFPRSFSAWVFRVPKEIIKIISPIEIQKNTIVVFAILLRKFFNKITASSYDEPLIEEYS